MTAVTMVKHDNHYADSHCADVRAVKRGGWWKLMVRKPGNEWARSRRMSKTAVMILADMAIRNRYPHMFKWEAEMAEKLAAA